MMDEYFLLHEFTKDLSVLYVEDDLNFQKETANLLGYFFDHMDLASNGKEALELYLSKKKVDSPYDLVITDIVMPKMNGIKMLKKIFKIDLSQIIIVISAHNESDYLIELINIGIEHYLMKPLNYEDVFEGIGKAAIKLQNKRAKDISDSINLRNTLC